MQAVTTVLFKADREFAGHARHGPLKGPYELSTHTQASALVLAHSDVVPVEQLVQTLLDTSDLNLPFPHWEQEEPFRPYPGTHRQSVCSVAPIPVVE